MPERVTERLVQSGHLTAEGAEEALERQVLMGGALDSALFELGLVDEPAVLEAMAAAYGLEVAQPSEASRPVDPRAVRAFPEKWARKHRIAPLALEDDGATLSVLSPAPADVQLIVRLGELLETTIRPVLAPELRVEERLGLLYGLEPSERHRALIASFGGQLASNRPSVERDARAVELSSAVAVLSAPESRDQVARVALGYLGGAFELSAFFLSHDGDLEGWVGRGPGSERLPGAVFPVDVGSTFRVVLDGGAQYLGPPPEDPTHASLLAHLDRARPRSLLLAPIRLRGRTVALFYADDGPREIPSSVASDVTVFLTHVASAMLELVRRRKANSFSQLPSSESVERSLPDTLLPAPLAEPEPAIPPSTSSAEESAAAVALDAELEQLSLLSAPLLPDEPDVASEMPLAELLSDPGEPHPVAAETVEVQPTEIEALLASSAHEEHSAEAEREWAPVGLGAAERASLTDDIDIVDEPPVSEEEGLLLPSTDLEAEDAPLDDEPTMVPSEPGPTMEVPETFAEDHAPEPTIEVPETFDDDEAHEPTVSVPEAEAPSELPEPTIEVPESYAPDDAPEPTVSVPEAEAPSEDLSELPEPTIEVPEDFSVDEVPDPTIESVAPTGAPESRDETTEVPETALVESPEAPTEMLEAVSGDAPATFVEQSPEPVVEPPASETIVDPEVGDDEGWASTELDGLAPGDSLDLAAALDFPGDAEPSDPPQLGDVDSDEEPTGLEGAAFDVDEHRSEPVAAAAEPPPLGGVWEPVEISALDDSQPEPVASYRVPEPLESGEIIPPEEQATPLMSDVMPVEPSAEAVARAAERLPEAGDPNESWDAVDPSAWDDGDEGEEAPAEADPGASADSSREAWLAASSGASAEADPGASADLSREAWLAASSGASAKARPVPAEVEERAALPAEDQPEPEPEDDGAFAEDVRARLDQLEHPMKRVRGMAREALAAMGPRVLPHLASRFPGPLHVNPYAPEVVLPAFQDCGPLLSLVAHHGRDAHVHVVDRLDSPDPVIRFFATYFYSSVYVPEAIPRLLQRLHDEEARICMTAARSLFGYRSHSGFKQVQDHLRGRLEASSVAARRHATFLIGLFRDVSAIPDLIAVLERRERALTDVAESALSEITKQRFAGNARKWNAWWVKNGEKNRIEWLIDGLAHRDEDIRRSACDELRAVTGQNFGFVPDGARRMREAARKQWLAWWAEQLSQGAQP